MGNFGKTKRVWANETGEMRPLGLLLSLLVVMTFCGCGKPTPDSVSDDDLYRAVARGDGESEESAVNSAHKTKELDPSTYRRETEKVRHYIKYYGSADGTTSIDRYVEMKLAERKKGDALNKQIDKENADAMAASKKAEDARNLRDQQALDIENKYDEAQRKVTERYKSRLESLKADASLTREQAMNKKAEIDTETGDERDRLLHSLAAEREAFQKSQK